MILAALRALALDDGLLENPHFEPKLVKYLVKIDMDGRFLGFINTEEPLPAGAKGKPTPATKAIPRRVRRTSADRADFLVDKADYVFGIAGTLRSANKEPPSVESLRIRRSLFLDRVRAVASQTQDEGALAVLGFLQHPTLPDLPSDHLNGDLFAFVLAGDDDLVSSRSAVAHWWSEARQSQSESGLASTCLVCGQEAVPSEAHPPIQRMPGGNSAGTSLVSFNARAFESFGLQRGENAPVCQPCADAYTTGLNRLLNPAYQAPDGSIKPRRSYRVGDATVCVFWSKRAAFDDFVMELLDGNADAVERLLKSPHAGTQARLSNPEAFHMAVLSGAQGRAVLRDWFELSIDTVQVNLCRFFGGLQVAPRSSASSNALPLRDLARSLAAQGKDDNVPQGLVGALLRSALLAERFPDSVLVLALQRSRAEGDVTMERAALIKAGLTLTHERKVGIDMEIDNTETSYRLGRLFAVLERLQAAAQGSPNATIVDRFYGAASSTPVLVFPRLLALAQHHVSKAENGTYFNRLIEQVLEPLDPATAFPSTLDLVGQGLFALGYYQQRADLWKPRAAQPSTEKNS